MIDLAKTQVGYHEGRKNGHWNNQNKYADDVPSLKWAQGQPWCAVFVYWLAMKSGAGNYFPLTASVPVAAKWFKNKGQWSEYPAIGAQVILGNYAHTGFVIDYDDTYVWTIEGNTNTNGSPEGDGVYLKKHRRRDKWVLGYGYPALPLKSADPKYGPPKPPAPKPTLAVDYSFARPKPSVIKKAGYSAVGRYLSNSPSKNISSGEAKALHAEGLGIFLVWETTAKRAAAGRDAGEADAKTALFQANTLGVPENVPLFFAVDFDASWAQVKEYLAGAQSIVGRRAGVYGGYKITTDARSAGIEYTWQTMAWSGGRIDANANILQRLRPTVDHPVQDTDENLIQKAFPLW